MSTNCIRIPIVSFFRRLLCCYNRFMKFKMMFSVFVALAVLAPFVAMADNALEVVDAEFVCMVNDVRYDKVQVRVDVNDQTYYGCCEMCRARLTNNENLRVGVDSISGKKVDKAIAIIAADSYNRVFYFENEENLEKANEKLSKKK